ncbi:hypothetical protein IR150_17120 [Providencia alcalifaciens]|uniref:hypothetical protein n=1 Tax=Providencia alcalifaciens TaxID=126385 RepID=UPI0015CFD8D3|nr:hypothetical protein [Providencia alcalifaciens]MBF0693190.1 hypothetical protein [Providencia alcalifaciens]NYS91694.1 hypothetical protein [Providencia alcalifaciens]
MSFFDGWANLNQQHHLCGQFNENLPQYTLLLGGNDQPPLLKNGQQLGSTL